jgi:hypothetical protein
VADPTTPGRVFISYRRADAAAAAGRLSDRIDARFGRGTAFMDVESIAPGTDFAEVIDAAVGSCTALVLGPVGDRKDVLLVTSGDPKTCDALGNAPSRGAFLIDQADMGGSDGRWSYTDHLGYDEAVTIARHYEFVTEPPATLLAIRNTRANWEAANPGKAGDYPGILALPADAKVLATFEVPAGVYQGAHPCR